MPDLDDRFRSLDGVRAPQLWTDISTRDPRASLPAHGARSAVAVLTAFIVAVVGIAWAALALSGDTEAPASGGSGPATSSTRLPSGPPVSVSAPIAGGTLECTASFPSSVLEPGSTTSVIFTVRNVSDSPRTVPIGINGYLGTLVVRSRGGGVLTDSIRMHEGIHGPMASLQHLSPGEMVEIVAMDPPIIWPGPLEVTPTCARTTLPSSTFEVAVSGAAPAPEDAVGWAASEAGVFDSCLPEADGSPVTGTVTSHGHEFPARCSAIVDVSAGFDVVTLAVVSPPGAPEVDLRLLRDDIRAVPSVRVPGSFAVSWWVYVVDGNGTRLARRMSVAQNCDGSELTTGGGIQSCDSPTRQ